MNADKAPNLFAVWLRETMRGLLWLLVVGAVVLLGAGLTYAYPSDSSLVLWLPLNESTGDRAYDFSQYNNTAVLINTPTWRSGASCVEGSCLEFNNESTEQMYAQYTSSLNITGQFTYTTALKLGSIGAFVAIFDGQSANANGFELGQESDGRLRARMRSPSVLVNSIGALTVGTWYNITMLWNGTDLVLEINRIYNNSGARTANLTENTQLRQWATSDNTSYFNGSMDCISLYNRTLNATELASNICTLDAEPPPPPPPPTVTIQSPTNTTYAVTSVWANVTLSNDTGNVTVQLDNSQNYSLTNTSGNWNRLLTGLGEGAHNLRVFANNSAGSMNSSQIVYFTVDTSAPVITIGSPTNTTLQQYNTTLNATANEAISVWQYSLNGGANVTFTPNITFIAQAGANNITVAANDTVGNRNTTTVYFTVTIPPPNLTITLYDETTELPVAGNGKTTNVTLRDPNTYATNITVNATNGTATFSFHGVNNTAWIVDAGLASTDYPYSRLTVVAVNQSNATVYLIPNGANPAFLIFVLNDLTGAFGGSLFQVKKNINGSQVELSRMNFDLEDKATAWMLLNNRYLLFIDNGAEVRSLGFFVPIANASKTIVLGNVSLAPVTFSSWKDIVIGLNWTNASDGSGTIFFRWNDTLNQTTAIELYIYNGTNETASQAYYVGSNASVFSTTYQGINNTNVSYLIKWKAVHSRFGAIEGRQLAVFFNMQKRVGLGALAPEPWHYLAFALMFIIILAGLFNAKNAALGGMVVVGAIILLNYWGWMQTSGIVVGTLAIIALIGKLKEGKA